MPNCAHPNTPLLPHWYYNPQLILNRLPTSLSPLLLPISSTIHSFLGYPPPQLASALGVTSYTLRIFLSGFFFFSAIYFFTPFAPSLRNSTTFGCNFSFIHPNREFSFGELFFFNSTHHRLYLTPLSTLSGLPPPYLIRRELGWGLAVKNPY